MAFLLVAGWFCTYSYFADYLGKAKGMNSASISSLLLLLGVVGLVGYWLAGKLLSNHRRAATVLLVLGPLVVAGALA